MTVPQNPIATEHLPFFITAPGETDALFNIIMAFVLFSVIGLGVIFFTIHSLPERMAHRTKKVQLDIVAVLCLIALFTNEHIYWIAALLLAFIDLPDFLTPLLRIASAAEKMAGEDIEEAPGSFGMSAPEAGKPVSGETERGLGETALKKSSEAARQIQKGPAHA